MGLFNKTIQKLKKDIFLLNSDTEGMRQEIEGYPTTADSHIKVPVQKHTYNELKGISRDSDILVIIQNGLTDEIFRNGWSLRPRFQKKCVNPECGEEFQEKVETCPICGDAVRAPEVVPTGEIERRFKRGINLNEQSLLDVSKQLNQDLEIWDNAFMMVVKEYTFGEEGSFISSQVSEVLRANPNNMRRVCDLYGRPSYNDQGSRLYTCVDHRDRIHEDKRFCPVCGKEMYPAYFYTENMSRKIYYVKGEILHLMKYNPSMLYGYSVLNAGWDKVLTLMYMDKYILSYYHKQRGKGIFLINSTNQDSVQKAWSWVLSQTGKDPHAIYPFAISSNSKQGSVGQYIDFSKDLSEMQFIETRNELRRQIGAEYGVMPIYHADVSTSGGLNNEGMQITVTNRAVERGQNIFNFKAYPFLMDQLGLYDYELVLNPNEEQDEMSDEQLQTQKIQNARSMLEMGYDVDFKDGDFIYSGEADPSSVIPQEPDISGYMQRNAGEPTRKTYKLTRDSIKSALKQVWSNEADLVEKEANQNIIIKEGSNMGQQVEDLYRGVFAGMTPLQSENIKRALVQGFKDGKSINEIVESMSDNFDFAPKSQIENIVRTEHTAIRNKMREDMFKSIDPNNTAVYKWIGADDDRTTSVCSRIKARTKRGVKMSTLKRIIKEESEKWARKKGVDFTPRDFLPHFGCRHTYTIAR